jgi:FkbM family methyltransferase
MDTLTVTRGDVTLEVLPAPDADLWDFWGRFAAGQWEPETFAVLDRFLTPGGTYVDVGAWVGPTVLYAARRCALVVAAEPDPVAVGQLRSNLALNGIENFVLFEGAIDTHRGGATLFSRLRWGDSMANLMVPADTSVEVPTATLADLAAKWDRIDLVKIDIEGAEARVLPDAVEFLAERHIPCLVSLHEPYWPPEGAAAVDRALARFERVTVLPDGAPTQWRTVLCEWE